jgi:anthraniloyl-CoA monooxygenase
LDTPFSSHGWSTPGRLVEVEVVDGVPTAAAGRRLDAAVPAPPTEDGLPAAFARLTSLAAGRPPVVAVYGGTPFTRTLLAEQARLVARTPVLLVDPDADRDAAVTAVLSGRADLVSLPR